VKYPDGHAVRSRLTAVSSEPDLHVDARLLPVLAELRDREPIFHRGLSPQQLEAQAAPDFWEIGASGRRYGRTFVLETVRDRLERHEADEPWTASDFHVRELAADTYLLTYTLARPTRVTRRTTVWRRTDDGDWQVVFHQGTPVRDELG
jgi:hypothetical protein